MISYDFNLDMYYNNVFILAMRPLIRVPANFGKEHINSPVHGNLVLKLREGREIKTNSMIMSLNSPVIDNLTTNLFQVRIIIIFVISKSLNVF